MEDRTRERVRLALASCAVIGAFFVLEAGRLIGVAPRALATLVPQPDEWVRWMTGVFVFPLEA